MSCASCAISAWSSGPCGLCRLELLIGHLHRTGAYHVDVSFRTHNILGNSDASANTHQRSQIEPWPRIAPKHRRHTLAEIAILAPHLSVALICPQDFASGPLLVLDFPDEPNPVLRAG